MAAKIPAAGVDLDGAVTVNESSADVDFRVETNGNANMFLVDGGNDAVIFNGSTSNFASGSQAIQIYNSGLSFTSGYGIQGGANTDRASINLTSGASGHIVFKANNSEVGRIAANGEMTLAKQPAVLVNKSSTQSNVANTDTITFDTERFDVNADFASNTFTAPVTGKYLITFCVSASPLDYDATYNRVKLVTSNRNYSFGIRGEQTWTANPNYHSFEGAFLVDMDAADTAKLEWSQAGGSSIAGIFDSTNLSIVLIC